MLNRNIKGAASDSRPLEMSQQDVWSLSCEEGMVQIDITVSWRLCKLLPTLVSLQLTENMKTLLAFKVTHLEKKKSVTFAEALEVYKESIVSLPK